MRCILLALSLVIIVGLTAFPAAEALTNRAGAIAGGTTVEPSTNVPLAGWDTVVFPHTLPSGRARSLTFSEVGLLNRTQLGASWSSDSAFLNRWQWCNAGSLPGNAGLPGLAATSAPQVAEDAQYIYMRTSRLELKLERTDGRLVDITDREYRTSFIGSVDAWWSLFDFTYRSAGQEQYIGGWLAETFSYNVVALTGGAALDLTWDGFMSGSRRLDIVVKVRIELGGDPRCSRWTISITNNEDLVIEAVDFPTLSGLGHIGTKGTRNYLAYPSMSGFLVEDPLETFLVDRGWGQMYPSTYCTMQFMTYYGTSPSTGLYIASDDSSGCSKFFDFSKPNPSWLHAKIRHIPEFSPGNDFDPPYAVIVGVFSGDWFDAAQMYRTWAVDQPWASLGPLASRTDIPEWYEDIGLRQWIFTHPLCLPDFNRFAVVPEVIADTGDYMGTPALASWIGWERYGWYLDYPDVFPPKEGWSAFEDTVRTIHSTGNRVLVIPNVTSLSDAASTWEAAKPCVCRDASGIPFEPWSYSECGRTATFYRMDPRTGFWQDAVTSLLNELVEVGVDAIQLDGFPVFGPQSCAMPVAEFPSGGGDWWASSYYGLFDRFRTAARETSPGLVLTSEGMAEFYIPLFESFGDPFTTGFSPGSLEGALVNDQARVQLMPLWHAVYHDYAFLESGISFVGRDAPSGAVGFGSYRDYYMRGFGLALVWGEMPSSWYADEKISDLDESSEREAAGYLRRIVELRTGAGRPYLMYGRMLRPPVLEVPGFLIAGAKNIPYMQADCPAFLSPSVLSSLWMAPDGDVAYILTNISNAAVTVSLDIDSGPAGLASGITCSLVVNRNGLVVGGLDEMTLPHTLDVEIAPLDVVLVEMHPAMPAG